LRSRSANKTRFSLEIVHDHQNDADILPSRPRSATCLQSIPSDRPEHKGRKVYGGQAKHGQAKHVPASAATCNQQRSAISMADFDLVKLLGSGGFGKVWLASKKSSGNQYAIKIQDKRQIMDQGAAKRTVVERELMEGMSHPAFVELFYSFQDAANVYMVISYCPCGTLFNLMKNQPVETFQEDGACFYASCLALALEHLHGNSIVYRDLKPENILIGSDGYPKLTDFGLAKKIGGAMTFSVVGTPDFIAPEIISEKGHTFTVDWWTLGVLVYEMLAGVTPFHSETTKDLFVNILTRRLHPFPPSVSAVAVDFITRLLVIDPLHRLGSDSNGQIGAQHVKAHPFFGDSSWASLFQKTTECPTSVVRVNKKPDSRLMAEDPFKAFANFAKPSTRAMPIKLDPLVLVAQQEGSACAHRQSPPTPSTFK